MKITSTVEYAARLMVHLAKRHGEAPVSAEKLSEAEHVPVDYVNQIMLRLRRVGLVDSHRGASGGYQLSREPAKITLAQVIRGVDGQILESVCERYDSGPKDCHHQGGCAISPVWSRLSQMIDKFFDGITLAQLSSETTSRPVQNLLTGS
jgi:Rrf2 family protein